MVKLVLFTLRMCSFGRNDYREREWIDLDRFEDEVYVIFLRGLEVIMNWI